MKLRNQPRAILSIRLFAITFPLLVSNGCSKNQPAPIQTQNSQSKTAQDSDVSHSVMTKDGKKFLRVKLFNRFPNPCDFKLSQITYRWYEPLDPLPMKFKLLPGETFEHDFSFLDEAWTAKRSVQAPTDVEISYSGNSASANVNSSNVNGPAIGLSYVDRGPKSNFLYLSDLKDFPMPRNLQVRVISILVNGKERLQKPFEFTLEPGGQKQVPSVTPKDEPVIKFATRLVPNKRWSIQSTRIEYYGTQ